MRENSGKESSPMLIALAVNSGRRPNLSDNAPQKGTAMTMAIRPIVFDHNACDSESPANRWVKLGIQTSSK
jgi:hypothetical protein